MTVTSRAMSRVPPAFVVAGVFFAQAILLVALVRFAPTLAVLVVAPIAGAVGAGACLAVRGMPLAKPASEEPWRLDAWGSLVAGFALPALAWSVGAEAVGIGWLVAALFVGLGTMTLAGRT
ncbi:MAG TPA: hypothetical protein VF103_01325 [Polyangiaceae bacterium]